MQLLSTLALTLTGLAPFAEAWSVAFYNSNWCDHGTGYYSYVGTGNGECIKLFYDTSAGDCKFFRSDGVSEIPCDQANMLLSENMGMQFSAGTYCTLGSSDTCDPNVNPVYPATSCTTTPKGTDEVVDVPQLWFQCWDGPHGGSA